MISLQASLRRQNSALRASKILVRKLSNRPPSSKNYYMNNTGTCSSPAAFLRSTKWQSQRQQFSSRSRLRMINSSSNSYGNILMPRFSFESLWISGTNAPEHLDCDQISSNNCKLSTLYAISPAKNSSIRGIIEKIKSMARTLMDAILVAIRSTEIALRLSPLLILTPAAILAASRATNANNPNNNKTSELAWNYTLYTVQSLGPAFVKICQWAAQRRDLFPQNVCDRLSQLHDGTFLHSWKYTHETLTKSFESFGINYHVDLGASELAFDQGGGLKINPNDVIGSGSVAQVYKGTLTHNGVCKQVAIKVLHPNIHERVDRDLSLMRRVAQLIHSLPSETIRMMNLPKVCHNFAQVMTFQIDLRNEAKNLHIFRDNFAVGRSENGKIPKVSFPRPILSDADCLIEDYEEALPMASYLKDNSTQGVELRKKLAGPLLRSFLKMVFIDNFIHSDLHQGNIKVRKSSVQTSKGKYEDKYTIVFLDCGIVTSLDKTDKQNLKDLFKAVITNNGAAAGRLMVERAKYERCSQVEGGVEQFSKGVGDIVSEFHDRRKQGLTLGVVRIGSLLASVLDLCRIHGVEIDPSMSNVVLSTLVLEGLGRCLDPDANLFDIALPFVLGFGKV